MRSLRKKNGEQKVKIGEQYMEVLLVCQENDRHSQNGTRLTVGDDSAEISNYAHAVFSAHARW
jgi:hypothetical protein